MGADQQDNKDGDDITRPQSQKTTTDPEKKTQDAGSEHDGSSVVERGESDVETLSHHEDDPRENRDDEHDDNEDDDQGPEGLNPGDTADADSAPNRTQSRASSTRSRALTIVPRSKRRGLFARFCVVPEVERPYDYSRKTKWTITLVVALAAAGGPLGSNLLYRK